MGRRKEKILNPQLDAWCGKFGDEYTARNKPDIFKRFAFFNSLWHEFKEPPQDILEVGCNSGANLEAIVRVFMADRMIGNYIAGIEPNERAARNAERKGFRIYRDIGKDLYFIDNNFDLVFCVGLLIHCELMEAEKMVREMARVSKKYLLFMEYFNKTDMEMEYRGIKGLLWKRNWPEHFKSWGFGKQDSCGFAGKDQGFDNVHWWIYKK